MRKIEIRAQQKPNTAEEIRKILSGTDIRTQRERERFINELQKRAGPNRNLTIEEFNSIVNEINRIIREERKKLDDEIRRKEFKEREKQRKLEEEQGITRVAKRKF
ncbi:MAG: hypothetical protein HYW05_01540 [Candidatus Diapherotrites archaeon]|nr:hypothetical protein [Candidatus Diapherotrites archaeon]